MRVEAFGLTDPGLVRELNEDRICVNDEDRLYIVADGMGGHAAGDVASELAVEAVNEFIARTRSDKELTWPFAYDENLTYEENRLKASIRLANKRILGAVEEKDQYRGMGSTLVALLVNEGEVCVGNVGDSRVYRMRNGDFHLMTTDHSWVNEQVQEGMITEQQAKTHPYRNVVTRALGSDTSVQVDLLNEAAEDGDRYLLCSDGLTNMLEDQEIAAILESKTVPEGLETTCSELVAEANRHGGADNISVILIAFHPDGEA